MEQVLEGFVYNELEGEGLFGLAGQLVIQPEYQRNDSTTTARRTSPASTRCSGATRSASSTSTWVGDHLEVLTVNSASQASGAS